MKIQKLSSKKSIFNGLIAVLAVTLFSGCEDVIKVDVINNSPKIVVDAFVNNQLDTQTIRLTRSIGYFDSTGKEPAIASAQVSIVDQTASFPKLFVFKHEKVSLDLDEMALHAALDGVRQKSAPALHDIVQQDPVAANKCFH